MQLQDLFPLQPQEYVPLFQGLFVDCYHFALSNPVNAGILAISVWVLTTVYYSIRLAFKNSGIRVLTKAAQDAVTALNAAQQQNQQLQTDLAAHMEQLELEQQRTLALQERIAELGGQIAESIVSLSSKPELGQQGLTVSQGLQPEHLWQRFSAAVTQLGESLIAEQQNRQGLQQTIEAETAKLSEKNLQMQALQFRLDSQKQQMLKLETSLEEQQTEFVRQTAEVNAEIAQLKARYLAEVDRYLELEKRSRQTPAVQTPVSRAPEAPLIQPVPPQPAIVVEPEAAPQAPAVSQPAVAAKVSALVIEEALVETESAPARPAVVQDVQSVKPEAAATAGSGLGGRFKSLFGKTVKSKQPEPQALEVAAAVAAEPTVEIIVEPVTVSQPVKTETSQKPAGGGKFGGLFANVQQKFAKFDEKFGSSAAKAQPVEPEEVEAPVVVDEPQAEIKAVTSAAEAATPVKASGGQLKGLLGKFRRKG